MTQSKDNNTIKIVAIATQITQSKDNITSDNTHQRMPPLEDC